MSNERGHYGRTTIGADAPSRGHSIGTWIVGGLVVGGAILWARHQSTQVARLYAASDLPYETFGQDLRARTRKIASSAGEKIQGIGRRLSGGRKAP